MTYEVTPCVRMSTTEMAMKTGCQENSSVQPAETVFMLGDRTDAHMTTVVTSANTRVRKWCQNCSAA